MNHKILIYSSFLIPILFFASLPCNSQNLNYSSALKVDGGDVIFFDKKTPPTDGSIDLKDTANKKDISIKWKNIKWLVSWGDYYMRLPVDEKGKEVFMHLMLYNDKYQLFMLNKPNHMLLYVFTGYNTIVEGPIKCLYFVDKKQAEQNTLVIDQLKKYFEGCTDDELFRKMRKNVEAGADFFRNIPLKSCAGEARLEDVFRIK